MKNNRKETSYFFREITANVLEVQCDAVIHQVNCIGAMGGGVALQIAEKYPHILMKYRAACKSMKANQLLGKIQALKIQDTNKYIINCFAQKGVGMGCETIYSALRTCLKKVNEFCSGKTIALPYCIGCGLAGGDWNIVYPMLKEELTDCNVLLCKLPAGEHKRYY